MAVSLPYLGSYKNLPVLFDKIVAAKVPDTFSTRFLALTLGLKASGDRQLIPFLRTLGALDAGNKPTPRYHVLRNKAKAKRELGAAIKTAYGPLFDSDERVHEKTGEELKGLISQVAGTDEDATNRIAYTFQALAKLADFTPGTENGGNGEEEEREKPDEPDKAPPPASPPKLRPEFHYNIQVHLPSNGTEETYLSIFSALRKVFQ